MTNIANSTVFPNPDTYLNHLSPSDAQEFEVCRNITLAVFGATIWDILIYIPDDIKIVRRSPFRFVIFCFIFSRLFAVGYVFLGVIVRTMPHENAVTLARAASCLCVLAVSCTSYLFLRRVHAVYAENRRVQWCFSVFWAIHSLSGIVLLLGANPSHIPGTHYTRGAPFKPYTVFGVFSVFLFDTSVFLAISWKIATTHSLVDDVIRWDTLVSGKALPRLSRAILRGGQQYYLITVGMTILVGVMAYLPSISTRVKITLSMLFIPFTASMACRVLRNIKLFDFSAISTNLLPNTS